MKASRIWAFIISLVICLSVTAPAYADASQTKVTVKKGDTVYGTVSYTHLTLPTICSV